MRTLLPLTVWDAALARINWLFDEFDHVSVNFSAGKDSVVILELALQVARERNRLPLEVLFIDQEAEWTSTVELVRQTADRPELDLKWLQCPIQIFNATSATDNWLWCWEEGKEEEWLHPKQPDSIHENVYGTTRFTELFGAFDRVHHHDQSVARINGVRCEESPARALGLTTFATYKHVTWGAVANKPRNHYSFSPIYDWSYMDIWKAIHDNGWPYNPLYDAMYQHGTSIRNMRVSNVHHETAVSILFYLQQIDIDLWNRLTERLHGVNSAKHMKRDFTLPPAQLPHMFKTWQEYRDYLCENLIENEEIRAKFQHQFAQQDNMFRSEIHEKLWATHVSALLVNDWHGTKMSSFVASNGNYLKGAGSQSRREAVNS